MKTHELKTWPEYFGPLASGDKAFELRVNDRDFQAGDTLILNEWDPKTRSFTGRLALRRVTFMLQGPFFNPSHDRSEPGLRQGWVIMSLAPLQGTLDG